MNKKIMLQLLYIYYSAFFIINMTQSHYKIIQFREDEFSISKIELVKDTALKIVNQSQQQKLYFVLMYEKQIDTISSLKTTNSQWEFKFEKIGNYQLSSPLTPKARPLLITVKQNLNGKSLFNYKSELVNQFAQNQSTTVSDNKNKSHRDHSLSRKKPEQKTQFTNLEKASFKESLQQFYEFDSQQSNDCLSNQNEVLEILKKNEQKKTCLTDKESKQKQFFPKVENAKPKNIKVDKQKKKGLPGPNLSNEIFLEDMIGFEQKNEFKKCVNQFIINNKNSVKKLKYKDYASKNKVYLSYLAKSTYK